jgi:hypothetical protein
MDKRSFSTSFLFLQTSQTLLALIKTCTDIEKGVVATLPFSKTTFYEKMQLRIFFLVFLSDFPETNTTDFQ